MTKAQHSLLEEKQDVILASHEERVELLKYFQNQGGPDFGSFFTDWALENEPKVEMPAQEWCEEIFRTHPWDDSIEGDYKLFNGLTRYELRQTSMWYSIHIKMIEQGILKSHFFAYDKQNKSTGLNNIKQALSAKAKQEDAVDACARNILRSMGGIPRVRGRRTTLMDCPTARFYWNYKLTRDIEEELKNHPLEASGKGSSKIQKRRKIYEVLQQGSLWERLVDALEYKITIFGNKRILAAFIAYIIELKGVDLFHQGAKPADIEKALNNVIKSLGPTTSVRHLSLAEPDEILAIFKKVNI